MRCIMYIVVLAFCLSSHRQQNRKRKSTTIAAFPFVLTLQTSSASFDSYYRGCEGVWCGFARSSPFHSNSHPQCGCLLWIYCCRNEYVARNKLCELISSGWHEAAWMDGRMWRWCFICWNIEFDMGFRVYKFTFGMVFAHAWCCCACIVRVSLVFRRRNSSASAHVAHGDHCYRKIKFFLSPHSSHQTANELEISAKQSTREERERGRWRWRRTVVLVGDTETADTFDRSQFLLVFHFHLQTPNQSICRDIFCLCANPRRRSLFIQLLCRHASVCVWCACSDKTGVPTSFQLLSHRRSFLVTDELWDRNWWRERERETQRERGNKNHKMTSSWRAIRQEWKTINKSDISRLALAMMQSGGDDGGIWLPPSSDAIRIRFRSKILSANSRNQLFANRLTDYTILFVRTRKQREKTRKKFCSLSLSLFNSTSHSRAILFFAVD